jgi:dihydrolipoamide dehydrogenase
MWKAGEPRAVNLDRSPKGVVVNDRMRTSAPGIWAAGDVTGKSLLAHSAYRMAEVAAADIDAVLDGKSEGDQLMRWDAVPWAVYSIPEAAGVGMTEKDARQRGFEPACVKIPLRASGRFAAENGFARPTARSSWLPTRPAAASWASMAWVPTPRKPSGAAAS